MQIKQRIISGTREIRYILEKDSNADDVSWWVRTKRIVLRTKEEAAFIFSWFIGKKTLLFFGVYVCVHI